MTLAHYECRDKSPVRKQWWVLAIESTFRSAGWLLFLRLWRNCVFSAHWQTSSERKLRMKFALWNPSEICWTLIYICARTNRLKFVVPACCSFGCYCVRDACSQASIVVLYRYCCVHCLKKYICLMHPNRTLFMCLMSRSPPLLFSLFKGYKRCYSCSSAFR